MDFRVQLAFQNVNAPEIGEYGVDHVRATEAFGGVGVRVFEPSDLARTLQWAREEAVTRRLPLVVDVITERVTNVAMGAEIDAITEFDEFIDLPAREAVPAK